MTQRRRSPTTDRGSGLVEVLVAIVLLGLGATGALTAITAAIRGSSEQSTLTGARRWLVSAADYVVSADVSRVPCTASDPSPKSAYESAARSVTTSRPSGWSANQLSITGSVTYWNGSTFGTTCYESSGLRLQQFTLQVTNPQGAVVETLTVVKRDG